MPPSDGLDAAAARGPFAGREGHLDAPFAATPPELVEAMLDLAGTGPGERLIDLGCGDGRIAIAAARRGATALGVDLDRARIAEAEAAARRSGVDGRVAFRREDMFATPLDEADIVTLYLLPHANRLLRPRLLTARPGARIVSHSFPIGDWPPDAIREIGRTRLYLWTVRQRARVRPAADGARIFPDARRKPA
jgi:SAM-dependent methyltransferase